MWNIICGGVMLIGGLSGKIALRGTNSSTAIAVLGGVLLLYGIGQVIKKKDEE